MYLSIRLIRSLKEVNRHSAVARLPGMTPGRSWLAALEVMYNLKADVGLDPGSCGPES